MKPSRFKIENLGIQQKGVYHVREAARGILCLALVIPAHTQVTLSSTGSETTVPRERMITYLFIGHSNMAGRTNDPEDLRPVFHQPHSRCWNFNIVDDFTDPALNDYHHQWIPAQAQIHQDMNSSSSQVQCGPAMAFLKQMATEYSDYYFGVTQNAESAASVWKYRNDTNKSDGPPLYSQILAAATEINQNTTIGGVVMMLCLADGLRHPDTYKQNVKDLVAMLRNDLDLPQLPVFISDYEYGSTGPRHPDEPGAQIVIQANQELPNELDHCYLIPTNEWSNQQVYMQDDHHYNLTGYIRWAEELVAVIKNNNLGPVPLSDTEPPSAPEGLVAENESANSIRVSWSASSDNDAVEKYAVFIDGDSAGSTGGISYLVENTTQCHTYTFSVKAFDFSGNISGPSNPLIFESNCTSDTIPPSPPPSLYATDTASRSITLLWKASNDNMSIHTYHIYQNGRLVDSTSDTTTKIVNLTPATFYAFFVRAVDNVGNYSVPSETLTVTTKNICADSFPLKINLGGAAFNNYKADQPYTEEVYYGYVTEGRTTSTEAAIDGTDDDAVYQSIRYGDFDYTISVPRGDYIISLLLAESFAGKSSGSRLFDVSFNNTVIDGCPVDIFDSAGADAALKLVREIRVQNTTIDISFRRTPNSSYSPVCSGFIIEQAPAYRIEPLTHDTAEAYDTVQINWKTNEGLVNEARLWISPDFGITWHEISPGSISDLDSSWENFAWAILPVIEGDTIAGKTCSVRITDYDKIYKIVADDQFYVSPSFADAHPRTGSYSFPAHIRTTISDRKASLHIGGKGSFRITLNTLAGQTVYRSRGKAPATIYLPHSSYKVQNFFILQLEYNGITTVQKLLTIY
ncbi:MAG: hypothetical protein GF401_14080 [Chitinivibrionales bacterium]|nr:hypothetical protein [Chitinivibrionales bacterium]